MNEIITALFLVLGSLFSFVAALGMLRLPDTVMRMHAATKAGALGAGLILIGEAIFFAELGIALRALAAITFLLLTAPVAAHLIGRAAYWTGIQLSSRTWVDHLGEDLQNRKNRQRNPVSRSGLPISNDRRSQD